MDLLKAAMQDRAERLVGLSGAALELAIRGVVKDAIDEVAVELHRRGYSVTLDELVREITSRLPRLRFFDDQGPQST